MRWRGEQKKEEGGWQCLEPRYDKDGVPTRSWKEGMAPGLSSAMGATNMTVGLSTNQHGAAHRGRNPGRRSFAALVHDIRRYLFAVTVRRAVPTTAASVRSVEWRGSACRIRGRKRREPRVQASIHWVAHGPLLSPSLVRASAPYSVVKVQSQRRRL